MPTYEVSFTIDLPETGPGALTRSENSQSLISYQSGGIRVPHYAVIKDVTEQPKFVPGYYRLRADGFTGTIRWYDQVPATAEDRLKYYLDDPPYNEEKLEKEWERIHFAASAE